MGVTSSVSSSAGLSRYDKDSLVCEGSEYCFEEVRAAKYFQKIKQEKEQRELGKWGINTFLVRQKLSFPCK